MIRKLIRWLYRSAVSGRFVSREEAEAHPESTVRERLRDKGDSL